MPINDKILEEISWKSYRDCHRPEARERIMKDHGESFFISRGIEFHKGIVGTAIKILEDMGYEIQPPVLERLARDDHDFYVKGAENLVRVSKPAEEDYSDLC